MGTALLYLWIGIAIVSIIVEVATTQLKSFWFSIGAIAAIITNIIYKNAYLMQCIMFVLFSAIAYYLLRPMVQRHFDINKLLTQVDSLIGKKVKIISKINKRKFGTAQIDQLYFRYKSLDTIFEIGEYAEIVCIKHNILYLQKIENHQN